MHRGVFIAAVIFFLLLVAAIIYVCIDRPFVSTEPSTDSPLSPSSSSNCSSSTGTFFTGFTGISSSSSSATGLSITPPPDIMMTTTTTTVKSSRKEPTKPYHDPQAVVNMPSMPAFRTSAASASVADDTASESGSVTSSGGGSSSGGSDDVKACQHAALDNLQQCLVSAGGDGGKQEACWTEASSDLSHCVPHEFTPTVIGMAAFATFVFNDSIPIGDKLDDAMEAYLKCMDSESGSRQSCVEQLFTDINASVGPLTGEQQAAFAKAQTDLQECLSQSTNIQQDFTCLRNFYVAVVDKLKLPLLTLEKKQKRAFASNKAITNNCYTQATASLKQCMQSISTIQDPTQREQAKLSCLKDYKELLNNCICTAYGSQHPGCQK